MAEHDPMELLSATEFWHYYQKGDEGGLDSDLLLSHFDFEQTDDGESNCPPWSINLDCLEYSFGLDIYADFYAINCWFRVPDDETEYQIGWWDFGEWHPFGLRWDELMKVWEYWKSNPDKIPVSPDQAFLLMAKFVGMGKSELPEVPARKQVVKSVYQRLGLDFHFKEINELSSCTFLLPPEDDYEWSDDSNLGPVFSGEYPHYSLRNETHASGEEGIFPFQPFAMMIEKL